MPAQHITDTTDYRNAHPHTVPEKYLSVVPHVVIFSGQINGAPVRDAVSHGVTSFFYDNDEGDWEDIIPNMTIEFGSLPGYSDYGSGRVHSTHPAVDGQIFIGEVDPVRLSLADNTYFSVIFTFMPHSKIPRIVGTAENDSFFSNTFIEYHDYDIVHNNFNNNFAPKANVCGEDEGQFRHAGWVDKGETTRLTYFDSSLSQSMAGGGTDAVWTFYKLYPAVEYEYSPDIVDGGLTQDFIQVNLPAGFYFVKLEAVCTFNGQRDYLWIPVWVHDEDYLPFEEIEKTKDSRKDGREITVRFFGRDNEFDESKIPKNTMCCYWEIPHFVGVEPPTHYIYAMLGWATQESTSIKIGNRSQFTLEVGGAATWLKELDSYHYHLNKAESVVTWYEMDYITTDRSLLYGIREYSTMAQLMNIHFSGLDNRALEEDVPKGKLWDQIKSLAGSICGNAQCDSLGGLWFKRHYAYLEAGDRYAEWSIALEAEDWTDAAGVEVTDDKTDPITMVTATGSDFSSDIETVVNSKASGSVGASDSGMVEQLPFLRLLPGSPQEQIDMLAGMHWKRLAVMRKISPIKILGNYDWFEPAWNEPIKLLQDISNIRGVTFEKLFLVTEVNVGDSNEFGRAKEITWGLEEITLGVEGDDWIIASENGAGGGEPFFPLDLTSPFMDGMAPFISGSSGHDKPKVPPACDDVPLHIIVTQPGMSVTYLGGDIYRFVNNITSYNPDTTVYSCFGGFYEALGRCLNVDLESQSVADYGGLITCDGSSSSGTGGFGGMLRRITIWRHADYTDAGAKINTTYRIRCVDEEDI